MFESLPAPESSAAAEDAAVIAAIDGWTRAEAAASARRLAAIAELVGPTMQRRGRRTLAVVV